MNYFEEKPVDNMLDRHIVAYQGGQLYDFDNEILLTWYPQRVLHHAGAAHSMLELGLGHGYTTDIFSRHFKRHVVVEGSHAVIRAFRDKHPECHAEIIESFFEHFSPPSPGGIHQCFDVIVMGFILEHVDDPSLILRRFRDFLAPGGRIFLAVPNAETLNRRLGHLAGLLENTHTLSEHDLLLGHKRYYTVDSLKADITQADYRLVRMEGLYLKPFTTRQMLSLQLDRKIIEALCTIGIDYPELSCGLFAEISP
jgi:SAM-dependent methyltransferase